MKYLVEFTAGAEFASERVLCLEVVEASSIDDAIDKVSESTFMKDRFFRKDRVWSKEWLDTHTAMDMFTDHIKELMK